MYDTTFEFADPPTEQVWVNLKYHVPVASPVSLVLPVVHPPVSLFHVIWSLEYVRVKAIQFVGAEYLYWNKEPVIKVTLLNVGAVQTGVFVGVAVKVVVVVCVLVGVCVGVAFKFVYVVGV